MIRQGTCDPNSLLLPAGHLMRSMMHPFCQPHQLKAFQRSLSALRARNLDQSQHQVHIFVGGESWQQAQRIGRQIPIHICATAPVRPRPVLKGLCPNTCTLPALGRSSPPMQFSRVVLPLPERPFQRDEFVLASCSGPRRAKPGRSARLSCNHAGGLRVWMI